MNKLTPVNLGLAVGLALGPWFGWLILFDPPLAAQYRRLPLAQQSVITSAHRNLQYLSWHSPKARELLRFYEHHAAIGRLSAGSMPKALGRPHLSKWFYVYIDLRPARLQGKHPVFGSWHAKERVLVLRDSSLSPTMQGINLAHELQHAIDRDLYLNPFANQLSRRWLLAEERANQAEYLILSEVTDGGWARAVWASLAERESIVVAHGRSADTFTLGLAPGDSIRLRRLFGPITSHDLKFLKLQLSLDANCASIIRHHQNDPASQTARIKKMYQTLYLMAAGPPIGAPKQLYEIR